MNLKKPASAGFFIVKMKDYFLGVANPSAVSSTNSIMTSSPALNFSRPKTLLSTSIFYFLPFGIVKVTMRDLISNVPTVYLISSFTHNWIRSDFDSILARSF